jgi:hypothetical protein
MMKYLFCKKKQDYNIIERKSLLKSLKLQFFKSSIL